MQLLDLLKLKTPSKRSIPKTIVTELKKIDDNFNLFIKDVNLIKKNIDFLALSNDEQKSAKEYLLNDINRFNQKIASLRSNIFSSNLSADEKYSLRKLYSEKGVCDSLDIFGIINLMPRTKLSEIKRVANTLGYCIFQEEYFTQEVLSTNKQIIPEVKKLLKSKGYNIFYLSPVKAFNYYNYLKNESHSNLSYWGEHESVFNSLFLASSVFKNLYSEISNLKSETQELREQLSAETKMRESLHNQFSDYVNSMNNTIQRIERSLNYFVSIENDKRHKAFIEARNAALRHNSEYTNSRFEIVFDYVVFDGETGEKTNISVEELPYIQDYNDEFRVEKHSRLIDNFVPVPTETKYLERSNYEKFEVEKFLKLKKLNAKSTESFKNHILTELSNNYLMIALKGDLNFDDQKEVIILANWGSGLSPETVSFIEKGV